MFRSTRWMLTATIALAGAAVSAQQQDFSKVEIKTTKVAGNVYMLEGSGGNIGVSVGPDGTPVVYDRVFIPGDRFRITRHLRYDTLSAATAAPQRRAGRLPSQSAVIT